MEEVAKLVVSGGIPDRVGQEIALTQDVTTLGRTPTCQIVIDDNFASRRHAQIVYRDEIYWLRDLNSKNGTLLNNERVSGELPLADGAEIRIGEVKFRFVDPAATRTHPGVSASAVDLIVDPGTREIWINNEKLTPPLSMKQFNLLHHLYVRAGEAVSKDEIMAAVWPETDTGVYDYQIDKMVSRVRERIGKEWIETVWGYGYRLKMGGS